MDANETKQKDVAVETIAVEVSLSVSGCQKLAWLAVELRAHVRMKERCWCSAEI